MYSRSSLKMSHTVRGRSIAMALVGTIAITSALFGGSTTAQATPTDPALVLWAAPGGSGTTCSETAPCSIDGAQARARAATASMTADVVIRLHGGVYERTQPLVLTSADSGRNGHQVRWEAAEGATPVISGGKKISNWALSPLPNGTERWVANIGSVSDFRQLYVDGASAVRARSATNPAGYTKSSTGFSTTAAASVSGWKVPGDLEIASRVAWTYSRCPVDSATGNAIKMAQPCWSNAHSSPYLQNDMVLWLENAIELLDEPGEWYFDRSGATGNGSNALYYIPRTGETRAATSVVVPQAESLLRLAGSSPSDRVSNVQVVGITFADTTWNRPSGDSGFAEEQANFTLVGSDASHWIYDGHTKTDAPLAISNARNVLLQGNTVTRSGGAGINVDDAAERVSLVGNRLFDIAASGIQIGSIRPGDQRPSSGSGVSNITVSNNYVHDVASEYLGGVGIFGGFVNGLDIIHNEIADVPYTGISVGWGWGYLDKGGRGNGTKVGGEPSNIVRVTSPTVAGRTNIAANRIENYMQAGHDGGAIYTLGAQPSSTMTRNYLLNGTERAYGGVYLDNGTSGYTVSENVVDTTGKWALLNLGADSLANPAAKNNVVTGNWANVSASTGLASNLNQVSNNNASVSGSAWPQAAVTVIAESGLESASTDVFGVSRNWRATLHAGTSSTNLVTGATATATNTYKDSAAYTASKVLDNSSLTRWATDTRVTQPALTVTFPSATSVNRVVFREAQHYDPRIGAYRLEGLVNGTWTTLKNGSHPTASETLSFPSTTVTALRLTILSGAPEPSIHSFQAFSDASPRFALGSASTRPTSP